MNNTITNNDIKNDNNDIKNNNNDKQLCIDKCISFNAFIFYNKPQSFINYIYINDCIKKCDIHDIKN